TYHLAVVVDDHLMKITHIMRGKEWISSTPKHVLLYRYFGWEMPVHAHLPLILNSDGKGKLSKRHGHASVEYYKKLGYLPEAILNYMSGIVWNHPEGKEIYSLDEFIALFEVKDIASQGPRFDLKKLDWVNGEYIRAMGNVELIARLVGNGCEDKGYTQYSKDQVALVLDLVKERLVKLSDFDDYVKFFFEDINDVLKFDIEKLHESGRIANRIGEMEYYKSLLLVKVKDEEVATQMIRSAVDVFLGVEDWKSEKIEEKMRVSLEENNWKIGDFFMVLRVGVTGRSATPPLFESMEIIGKEICISRLQNALKVLS
ncbi:MAG: glutamate--tRNA ligase family protein, partial [bacterium]|nr:glutamate--tRNA ligase family protein [bacterium]